MDLSSEENAKKQGEAVYLNWLVKNTRVESKNLDLPLIEDLNYQTESFGKDAAFAFLCLRPMNTLFKRMEQGQEVNEELVKQSLNDRINMLKVGSDWVGYNFSLENLFKIFKSITKEDLSFDIKRWKRELIGQHYHLTILNDIFRSSIKYRDIYTVEFIIKQFETFDRIFAVMGALHVYAEEPALKEWFK